MRFTWDPNKARLNWSRHKVRFEDAALVFRDPLHLIVGQDVLEGEERLQAIGQALGRLLFVVHVAIEDDRIRIISARKVTGHERRRYEGR